MKKYLPLGTVVLLKGAKKRLMITGFCCIDEKNRDIVFDYCGCLYPEGIINSKQTALFNHEQIEKIYFLGLQDQDELNFKAKLNQIMNDKNKNNNV